MKPGPDQNMAHSSLSNSVLPPKPWHESRADPSRDLFFLEAIFLGSWGSSPTRLRALTCRALARVDSLSQILLRIVTNSPRCCHFPRSGGPESLPSCTLAVPCHSSVKQLCAAALHFAFLLRFASTEGDEYLGFSGRFLDPCYCHRITDLSEDSEDSRAVVVDFPSDSCKLK